MPWWSRVLGCSETSTQKPWALTPTWGAARPTQPGLSFCGQLTGEGKADFLLLYPKGTPTPEKTPTLAEFVRSQGSAEVAVGLDFGKAREVTRRSGVNWRSSDTTVAKVTRTTGKVYWRGPGTAVISVTYP